MKQKNHLRYLAHSDYYFDEIFSVWDRHMQSKEELCELFNAIDSEEEKDLFLRIGAYYKYLVVKGGYQFPDKILNQGMSYIDETYKYIAIFSLIEALETPPKYCDFYKWLQDRKNLSLPFNQKIKAVLDEQYQEYKKEYGSTRAAVRFFERLDDKDKEIMIQKIQIDGDVDGSLKNISQLLYDIRSKFVHNAQIILSFGAGTSIGYHEKGKVLVNKLTMNDLCTFFERGFLKRFGWK